MNLEDAIREEHSKAQARRIANWVGSDEARFAELIGFVLGEDETLARRASWAMCHAVEDRPHLADPHLEALVALLDRGTSPEAVRRHAVKILQFVPLPEGLLARIYDVCLRFLSDPAEPAAVRAYSMVTLHRICEIEPALAQEVALVIGDALPTGSPALRAGGRKILGKLDKLAGKTTGSDF